MNQHIQIQDGFEYDDKEQALKLTALVSGLYVPCFLSGVSKCSASAFYSEHLFDIEECLTSKIENEDWENLGAIYLSASDLA